jgi:uncharacterized protein YhaN
MRFLEIHIENFGIHHNRTWEFQPGFQPVFGENESGKSTLLELIRQLLYGFAHINPYAFEDRGTAMAASAVVKLDDSRQLRFRRRKGKGSTLSGNFEGDDTQIEQSTLDRLLSGTSPEMYKQIFGFSLDELSAGQEGLTRANLQQVIFGSGLGSLDRLSRLQKKLREERDRLFLPSARAQKPEINSLVRRIQELSVELRAACVRPHAYRQLVQRRDALDAQTRELSERRTTLRRRQSRLQRILQALPQWCRLRDLRRQMTELDLPAALPANLAERYQQLQQRGHDLSAQVSSARTERERLLTELESHVVSQEYLRAEPQIRQLQQQLSLIESIERELPDLTYRVQQQAAQLAALLERINPDWDADQIRGFHVKLADRIEFDALRERHDVSERRRQKLNEQLHTLKESINKQQIQLDQCNPPVDISALQRLLNEQGTYRAKLAACDEIDTKRMELEQKLATVRQQLIGPMQQNVPQPENLPIPMLETIELFRQKMEMARDRSTRASQVLETDEANLAEKQQELELVGAEMSAPDRDTLRKQRRRRDEGWDIIRRMYVLGQDATEDARSWTGAPDASLPELFETELHRADEMADQRQEQAALVAQKEQLEREVQMLRARVVASRKKYDASADECRTLDEEWRRVWRPAQIKPLSPDEMKHWLRNFQNYITLRDEDIVMSRRRRDLQDGCDDFVEDLAEQMPDLPDDPNERLRVAALRVEDARRDQATREAATHQLHQLTKQREALQEELAELQSQHAAWQSEWTQWLKSVGFPETWTVAVAAKITEAIEEVNSAEKEAKQLARRQQELTKQLDQFESEARGVVQLCDATLAELPACNAVTRLIESLEQTQHAAQDRRAIEQSMAQHQAAEQRAQQQLMELEQTTHELWRIAGVDNQGAMEQVVERQRQYLEWAHEAHGLSIEIAALRGNDETSQFEEELNGADRDACEFELQELEGELSEADAAFEQSHQQLGVASAELEKLDDETKSLTLAAELECCRAELAQAVDRWAPLVLAEHLLAENMQRFEMECQPALLQQAQQFLERMTDGRYVTVRRQSEAEGLPEVYDAEKQMWKAPSQLSRGTREQLYLAIRLAYVMHHCRNAESLPLVVDDVLVNFDGPRARRTLELLRDVAEHNQVLFLTCQASTLELIRETLPDVVPVSLQDDLTGESGEGHARHRALPLR